MDQNFSVSETHEYDSDTFQDCSVSEELDTDWSGSATSINFHHVSGKTVHSNSKEFSASGNSDQSIQSRKTDDLILQFARQKLTILKVRFNTTPCNSTEKTSDNTDPCYLFRQKCMQRLQKQIVEAPDCSTSEKSVDLIEKRTVHNGQTERLKLEALNYRMSSEIKKLQKELDESEQCQTCRQKEQRLAERDFIRRKVNLITKPSLERRVEKQLYNRDPITLLGEVVNSCARPAATSEEIWQKMREKLDNQDKL